MNKLTSKLAYFSKTTGFTSLGCFIFMLLVPTSSFAEDIVGKVVVNGKEIPSFYFKLRMEVASLDKNIEKPYDFEEIMRVCKDEMHDFVFESVVSMFLFREAGRQDDPRTAKRLSKYNVFSDNYEGDEEAPKEGSLDYEFAKYDKLFFEAGLYMSALTQLPTTEAARQRYNSMIEDKHSFVTNVPVYKLNTLFFKTHEEAAEARKRLKAGESYKALIEEFEQSKYYAVRYANEWIRYGSLLDTHLYIDKPAPLLAKGQVTEPIEMFGGTSKQGFGSDGWNVFQVVDKKIVPVVDFDDEYSPLPMPMGDWLREYLKDEEQSILRKRQWKLASITVDGIEVPEHSGRVKFYECNQ